jgi:hypothetical protein
MARLATFAVLSVLPIACCDYSDVQAAAAAARAATQKARDLNAETGGIDPQKRPEFQPRCMACALAVRRLSVVAAEARIDGKTPQVVRDAVEDAVERLCERHMLGFRELHDECKSLVESSEDKMVDLVVAEKHSEFDGVADDQRLSRRGASQKFCASAVQRCDGAAATAAAYHLAEEAAKEQGLKDEA